MLYTSYKGFYCAICQQENHNVIDTDKRTIQFSEKFCRDIVENSLNHLLFFHVDVVKYANLVSKFLLSCDNKGNFEPDVQIPEEHVFVYDDQIKKYLLDCRKHRNSPAWFLHCSRVCENFEISSFSPFFEPEFKKVKGYVSFLQNQQVKLIHGGNGQGISTADIVNKRVLEEIIEEKKKQLKHKKKQKKLKSKKVKKDSRKLRVDDADHFHDSKQEAQRKDIIFGGTYKAQVPLE